MPCHGTQELSISRCEGRGDCSDPPRYYRRLNRWARSLGPPKYPTLALEISPRDRKSTRLNSSHGYISYAVFCLKKKKHDIHASSRKRDSSISTSVFDGALRC